MSSYGEVKAEAAAVRELASAITRYAEHLRTAADQARRDARQLRQHAEHEAEQRRAVMERARSALDQAQAALSRCREGCGGLQQAVHQARQRLSQAEQSYNAARRAVGMIVGTETELLRSLSAAESVVAAHAPVSVKALTELEARLREYDRRHFHSVASSAPAPSSGASGSASGGGHASFLQTVAFGFGLARVLTGQAPGLAATPFIAPAAEPVAISLQTEDQERVAESQQQWAEGEIERLKEQYKNLGLGPNGA